MNTIEPTGRIMDEFGSDFHRCDFPKGNPLHTVINADIRRYVSGRQALIDLVLFNQYSAIYMPSYFCQEVIGSLRNNGIKVRIYEHTPFDDINISFKRISPNSDEALFISNYFGLETRLDYDGLPQECEIIEDHTHDLLSDESLNSHADWCISSLRKSIPVAEGGILWSPKRHIMPHQKGRACETEIKIQSRYRAMNLKREYLLGRFADKNSFLSIFRETEEQFDSFVLSDYGKDTKTILNSLDFRKWDRIKFENWQLLTQLINSQDIFRIFGLNVNIQHPFSLILLFQTGEHRNIYRRELISQNVYPAILWHTPEDISESANYFSDRMLSIHCDARYNKYDIIRLADIMNGISRKISLNQ